MPILNSLTQTIQALRIPGGLTVERRDGARVDEDGNPSALVASTFTVDPVVFQPASGRDLLQLPQGSTTRGVALVHTTTPLRTAQEAGSERADVIRYPNPHTGGVDRYRVTMSADWIAVGGFVSVLATRLEADA